ncbi:DNA-binding protein [Thiocystis violacea]|uniref:DNA-binding protein n=1 Tax=Thiocystis violacea TaxID=13725 RepID=UPI00190401C6|nr:DNA-binding protein [Thiocystis violacea]MBK1725107.1 hypothetical protein [Thiocystis violacea]
MARGGITQTEVKKAREALIARGLHPSIDAVRIELGNTGSKTTIHRHLQTLEEREGRRLDDEAVLSEGLRESVASLARQLRAEAQTIVADAQTRHLAEQEALRTTLRDLERERDAALGQVESLQAELKQTRTGLAETQAALTAAQIETKTLETEKAGLGQRLAERSEHVESLEQKHRQARDALEHYRQLSKEQRDQDHRNHEAQVQQLQSEARRRDQLLAAKQDELTRVASDNARLSAELGERAHREREYQEALARDRQRIETLLEKQARLQAEHAAQGEAMREATATTGCLNGALDQLKATLAERDRRLHGLEGQLQVLAALQKAGSPPDTRPHETPEDDASEQEQH